MYLNCQSKVDHSAGFQTELTNFKFTLNNISIYIYIYILVLHDTEKGVFLCVIVVGWLGFF